MGKGVDRYDEKITVHMTKEALFDFLLFHAYSKFTGFLVNILGLAVAFMGIILYVTDRTGTVNLVFLSGGSISVPWLYADSVETKSCKADQNKSGICKAGRLRVFGGWNQGGSGRKKCISFMGRD